MTEVVTYPSYDWWISAKFNIREPIVQFTFGFSDHSSTPQTRCTLQNIACWGRHYHLSNKKGGYANPATNSADAVSKGPLGGDNPLKVGVGTAANLPKNAIGNLTLTGHVFHNDQDG